MKMISKRERLDRSSNRKKLAKLLATANGRRRTRTLEVDDIIDAAADLEPGEHVFLHAGHVANSYGYPAVATGAVVWIPQRCRNPKVIIKVVPAQSGSTGFGRESCWEPDPDGDAGVTLSVLVQRCAFASLDD